MCIRDRLGNLPLLEEFGFQADDFGGGALAVREAPDYLDVEDIPDTLSQLAQKLLTTGHADPAGARDEPVSYTHLDVYKRQLYDTQKTDLGHIAAFSYYTTGQFMELDLTARQTLELTETLRGKEKKGSLLWVMDKTKTPMGHRLIRGWMERPLLSPVSYTHLDVYKRQQWPGVRRTSHSEFARRTGLSRQ